jgi:ABC-type uncharacterized transport system involved in gliding motility auxiliary subunit
MQDNEKVFFLNAVDSLTKDDSLIQIRSKGKFTRPLDVGIKRQREFFSKLIIVLNTIGMPFIIIIFGFVVFAWRKNKNNEKKAQYNP